MRKIGIDYGRRRIGVAITDELGVTSRPLTVIDRRTVNDPIGLLAAIVTEQAPGLVVVGLPLDHNDDETVMSREVRAFAAKLAAAITVPIEFVDESLTSRRASLLMMTRRKKQRRDKTQVDRIAACLILETHREDSGCAA